MEPCTLGAPTPRSHDSGVRVIFGNGSTQRDEVTSCTQHSNTDPLSIEILDC